VLGGGERSRQFEREDELVDQPLVSQCSMRNGKCLKWRNRQSVTFGIVLPIFQENQVEDEILDLPVELIWIDVQSRPATAEGHGPSEPFE
jgi:hypothetical protein